MCVCVCVCVFMDSGVLYISRCGLVLYSAGSGMNSVHVLSGLGMRLLPLCV